MIRIMFNICIGVMGGLIIISAFPVPSNTPPKQVAYQVDIPEKIIEPSPLYTDLDLFCLAKNIFHEAGTEPEIGQYAVAQVTLNRVRNPKYPETICKVVLDKHQFSWANKRSRHWTHPKGANWDKSYEIAQQVMDKGYRVDGLENVRYYHADYVKPHWSRKMTHVATVGRHVFYTNDAIY